MKMDISNAFNSVARLALRNSLERALTTANLPAAELLRPQLRNVDAKMHSHTHLRYGNYDDLRSCTGTIQGDPAAAQEFDVPLCMDVIKLLPSSPNLIQSWFQDDGHFCAPLAELATIVGECQRLLGTISLKMKPSKCIVYSIDPARAATEMTPILAAAE
jgi:hypothetical protein